MTNFQSFCRKRRFEDVKVGDFLMKDHVQRWHGNGTEGSTKSREYAVVTDLWFDPCKGETDRQLVVVGCAASTLNSR